MIEINLKLLKQKFPQFEKKMLKEMLSSGIVKEIPEAVEVIRHGQYLKMLPVVLDGVVKVYSQYEDKEFLLYYIKSQESCIMSMSAVLHNSPSRIFAVTGTDTVLMMFPVDKVKKWVKTSPAFNSLFYNLYDDRYSDLINTLNQVLFEKLDKRLYEYLQEKSKVSGLKKINITHKVIATELGTAREVVSRILKKLENNKQIIQGKGNIELLY
ncbi:MAG: Crp/Fnr family transcriptional regulator [Bacteroidales bacterium]|nr:Crp/Fnr family transcriptional regulator [Bacteroidales bacterium]